MTDTTTKMQWRVEWFTDGRQPRIPPDPAYPEGVNLVERADAGAQCLIPLPYPAPCCGGFLVTCGRCNKRVYITAAGRPDDPRSLMMACAPRNSSEPAKEAS